MGTPETCQDNWSASCGLRRETYPKFLAGALEAFSKLGIVPKGTAKSLAFRPGLLRRASRFPVAAKSLVNFLVADYIHLNPARAGLAGGANGILVDYEWSSLPAYQRGKGPAWLLFDRVLAAFELAQDGRGRRAYVDYLEKRGGENGDDFSEAAMAALRSGWYLGDETFRDQLLGLVRKGSKPLMKKGSHAAAPVKGHGAGEAERMVLPGLGKLGLADEAGQLIQTRKARKPISLE